MVKPTGRRVFRRGFFALAMLLLQAALAWSQPTVSLDSPPQGTAAITGTYLLEASASDADGIQDVRFYVDGVSVGTDTSEPYEFTLNTGSYGDGNHSIEARATNINLETASETLNTVFDQSAPDTLSLDNPSSGTQSGTITMSATAFDTQSQIEKVEFLVDGNSKGEDSSAPYTLQLDTSTLADGTRSYQAQAYNRAGLTAIVGRSLLTDNSPPVLSMTQPVVSPLSGNVTMAAVGNDPQSGITVVEFLVDGVVRGTDTGPSPYSFIFNTVASGLADGAHNFQVRATNGVNAQTTTPTTSLVVDNSAPVVTLTNPGNGTIIRSVITIAANATDTASGISQVQFVIDGGNFGAPDTSAPFELVLDTTALGNGNHSFRADATNGANMVTQSAVANAQVDNTAPTVTLDQPAAGPLTGVFLMQASASDGETDVTQVEFLVDGVVQGSDSTPTYQFSLDSATAGLFDGTHSLQARATDRAGNQTSALRSLVIDNSPPSVTIQAPLVGPLTGTFLFRANATDNDTNVSEVRFYVDGGLIFTDNVAPYEVNFDSTTVADASHTFRVEADNGVALMAFAESGFVVDNSAPNLTQTGPPGTPNPVSGSIDLTADASDLHSGITMVEFLVDGNPHASMPPDTTTPYGVSFDTSQVVNGAHVYSLRATNGVGLTTTSGGVSLTSDNSPPTVSLTSPTGGAMLTGQINLEASAGDSDSQITQVEFLVDGARLVTVVGTGPNFTFNNFDTSTLGDGSHTFAARATNGVGLTQTSPATTHKVDNTGPITTLNQPGSGPLAGSFDLVATASDAVSNMTQVEFFVDGVSVGVVLGAGPTFTIPSFDSTTLSNASHNFTATGTNGVLLTTQSNAASIVIDNSLPVVTYDSPTTGPVTGSVQLQATATDAESGISQVEFFINNVSVGTSTVGSPFQIFANTTVFGDGGPYPFRAEATNGAGLVQTTPDTNLSIDNSAPSVSITLPLPNAYASGDLTIQAAASDLHSNISQVEFFVDGSVFSTDTVAPSWMATLITTNFGDGTHTIRARASNGAGMTAVTAQQDLRIDNSPPSVFLTNPGGLTPITGTISLTANALDFNSGITQVDFFVDAALVGSASGSPFTTDFDTSVTTDGSHDFSARAFNGAGLNSVSATISVTVDNSVPNVALTTPTPGSSISGNVLMTATASDPQTEITEVAFLVDGVVRYQDTNPPYEFTFTSGQLADGTYNFEARATNRVGLISFSAPALVTVDNSPPDVALTSPLSGFQTGIISFVADASDPDSSVTQVEFYVDGGATPFATDLTPGFVGSFDSSTVSDGPHNFHAEAENSAGLSNVSTTAILVTDNSPPQIIWESPTSTAVSGSATLKVSATDLHSGITQVQFFQDAVLIATLTGPPFESAVDTTVLPQGPHDFLAIATNGVGMTVQTSPSPALIVDNSAPSTYIMTPTTGYFAGTLSVQASATDTNSTISLVEILVDGTVAASSTAGPFTTNVDTTLFSDGIYTLESRATNAAGLTTLSTSASVTFDNSPASVNLTAPTTDYLTGSFQFQAAASDGDSGVLRVDFLVDSVVVGSVTTSSAGVFSLTSDSAGYTDGAHTLGAIAINGAGLSSLEDTFPLVVDNSPPSAYVSAPTTGPLMGSFDFTATVDDPHSGINWVQFQVDSNPVQTVMASPFTFTYDSTSLTDGNHDFRVLASNPAGLTTLSTAVTGILIDNSLPVVTVVQPLGGGVTGSFTFQGTALDAESNLSLIELLIDGVVRASTTVSPFTTTVDSVALGLPDGQYDIQLQATNGAGGTTATPENLVYIDNSDPNVSLTAPLAGSTLAGIISLDATADDPHSGITQVEFLVDSVSVSTDLTAPYSTTYATTLLLDGNHDFQARATNGSGLTTTTLSQISLVDNSAPAVVLTSPTVGPLKGSFPATASATDPHSGITQVEFLIDSVVVSIDAFSPYQTTLDTVGLAIADGNHSFQARGTNGSLLQTLTATTTIMIDNSAPNLALTSPTIGPLTGNLDITATADDLHTGITQVEFLIDGSVVASDATSPYLVTTDTTTLSDGNHSFQAQTTNGVATFVQTTLVNFIVDNSPPAISLTAPTGVDVRGTIPLTANASDPHTGISLVEFLIDGAVVATDSTSPFTVSTDTTTLGDGTHAFSARATNGATLTALTTSMNVIVDNSIPTVSLVNPPPVTSTATVLAVMPTARSLAMADSIGSSIYVAGGLNAGGTALTTFEQYLTGSGAWTPLSPMGTARAGAFHGALGGKFYVAGGKVGVNAQTNVVESFDPLSGNWTVEAASLPVARERGASMALGDQLFAFGGMMGSATVTGTVDVFSPATGWTNLTPMPTPRYGAAAVAWEDDIYILGGFDGAGTSRAVEIYDVSAGTWRTGDLMAQADMGHAAVVVGRTIFTLGGSAGVIQAYDPLLGTWSVVDPMPAPVTKDVAFTTWSGDLYLAGGDDGAVSTSFRRFVFPSAKIFNGLVTLQSAPVDANSGIASVTYLIDGGAVGTSTAAPFDVVYDTSVLTNNFHDFRAMATNGSGLTATTSSRFFSVHNIAPLVTLTNPVSGGQTGVVTMTATASDQVRLVQVEFLVDGGVVSTDPLDPFSYAYDTSILGNGTHNFQARATGASGLQTLTPALNLLVDNTPPTVTLDSPTGTYLVGSFNFAATAADPDSGIQTVEFLIDSTAVFTDSLFPYGTAYDTVASGLPDGSHAFQARATNFSGLATLTATATLIVDNSAPAVTLDFPTVTPVSGSINMTATATDPHSGISQVEFLVDGVLAGTDVTNPYVLLVDTTLLADGNHTFQARTTNHVAMVTSSTVFTVTVDNTPPTVSFDSPTVGPLTGVFTMVASGSDPQTGVTTMEFLVDGALVGSDSLAPFTFAYDSAAAALPDGNHNLSARAFNAAGGSATSGAVSLLVDNSAPVVALTSPSSTPIEGMINFTATASDAQTGITQVEFLVDGVVVQVDTTNPYGFSYDLRTLANGAHNFQARGTNGVAMTTLTAATAFVVANPGPPDLTLGGDGEGGNGSDVVSDDAVLADGVSVTTKTVTIRDSAGKPIFDLTPTLVSSRAGDVIVATQPITDAAGQAIFQISSTSPGTSVYTASLNGVALADTAQTIWSNVPPTANAGPNRTVDPAVVTLDGSGSSDPNGGTLSYTWVQTAGAAVTIQGPSNVKPTVTLTATGSYTFQLTVSDGMASDVASVTITINNVSPVADAGQDFTTQTGAVASLNGSGSADGNGDALTYFWAENGSNPVGGTLSSAVVAQPSLTIGTVGIYRYTLVVHDGNTASPADEVIVTAQSAANQIPSANAGPDRTVQTGTLVQLDGAASSDPDGTIAGYTWSEDGANPAVGVLSATNIVNPSFTPTVAGTFRFQLVVTDNSGNNSLSDEVVVTSQAPGNGVPIACALKTSPSGAGQVGSAMVLDGTCSGDPDGDTLTYSWDLVQPMATAAIGTTAVLNYTPIQAGTHRFRLTVNDGTHSASTTVDVPVVSAGNAAPTVSPSFTDDLGGASSGGTGTSQVGAVITLNAGANDADGDPLSYLWQQVSGPAALLSSQSSATPTFTPGIAGTYLFRVFVEDAEAQVSGDLNIAISSPGNGVPVAVQDSVVNGRAGEFVMLNGAASYDPDGDPLTHYWTQISGTPILLSNPNSATPSFVPPAAGNYAFEHQVFDGTFYSPKGGTLAVIALAATGAPPPDPGGVIGTVIGDAGGGGGGCASQGSGGRSSSGGLLLLLAWLGLALGRFSPRRSST
jgi:hypothetical protein